jgi:hypothetical protein
MVKKFPPKISSVLHHLIKVLEQTFLSFGHFFATWHKIKSGVTHTEIFCEKFGQSHQISWILFYFSEIAKFRKVGCQNRVGFLKFSTFLSEL